MRIPAAISTLFLFLFIFSYEGKSLVIPSCVSDSEGYIKIGAINFRDIEKFTGRKPGLKEKISFLFIKAKIKHEQKRSRTNGSSALLLATASAILLVIAIAVGIAGGSGIVAPFVIMLLASLIGAFLAFKKSDEKMADNKDRRKGYVARVIAIAVLETIGLIGLIALALLSS